ncbi:MAG: hypothetical protein IRY91_16370 [Gemmatimonadaceae bacterium]|nr:hypothetical protein [Gemmatimonadaceae bacterium]
MATVFRERPGRSGTAVLGLCAECMVVLRRQPATRLEWLESAYDADRAAELAAQAGTVAPALGPLIATVLRVGVQEPLNIVALRHALIVLLEFLASPAGRTHANCRRAAQALSQRSGWAHVPLPLGDLMRTMGGPMRGTVWDAELTAQLGATPEQLLARLRAEW